MIIVEPQEITQEYDDRKSTTERTLSAPWGLLVRPSSFLTSALPPINKRWLNPSSYLRQVTGPFSLSGNLSLAVDEFEWKLPQEIPKKKTNLCPSSDWFVRKITYLMVKTMVSCRLSLKPIQWVLFKTPKFRPRGFSSLPGAHHQANEADHSEAGGRQLRDFRLWILGRKRRVLGFSPGRCDVRFF